MCVGDALAEDEWAAQEAEWAPLKRAAEGRQAPPPARRLEESAPRRPGATRPAPTTTHDTDCPPAHKHTSRNKPLTDGSPGKGYVDEERRRRLCTTHR
ncbi:hypothetical protein [Kitasatospora griseola]|uniref:hypothetical protein n=1 Tax=Kitasatospora griseola TaxID=2064 RepID=UPI00166F8B94|nr:hypothetical protein [Kitasatospora griseola]GGQ88987.1 hypothetical protein GCM10010195_50930 [Kitasatospora griseola]